MLAGCFAFPVPVASVDNRFQSNLSSLIVASDNSKNRPNFVHSCRTFVDVVED